MPLDFKNPIALPEITEPALEDLFIIVHDPSGVPTLGKVQAANLPIAGPAGPTGPAGAPGEAPLDSPAFTGVPTAPTADVGTNTDQLATTAFVLANGGTGGVTLPIAESDVTGLVADLAAKAPLASPALTGTPTTPTAAPGTNTTQIATTAFVAAATAGGGTGSVTHTAGALTADRLVVGNAADDLKVLGAAGTATQVLHGNASGPPAFSAVSLTADVTGVLPSANGGVPQALGTTDAPQVARLGLGAAADGSAVLTIVGQVKQPPVADGNTGTAKTFDWDAGAIRDVTETANWTATFSHPKDGARYAILRHTGAGGFTPTWPANVAWIGGTPTFTTTASKLEVITLLYVLTVDTYLAAYGSSAAGGGGVTLPIAESDVTSLVTDLAAKAPLASPTFTGSPAGPTPSAGDNSTKLATTAFVQAAIALTQTITLTGTQNDVALTAGITTLRCNNATLLTINGLSAGYDGQEVTVVSVGAGQVDFAYLNTGSSGPNRLINIATSAPTSLAAGSGRAIYRYDGTSFRWRLIYHDQGAAIAYTATWTASITNPSLGNGSITASYILWGRVVDVFVQLSIGSTTTLGSGYWIISVPIAISGVSPTGAGFVTTGGGAVNHPIIGTIGTGLQFIATATEANVDATHPATMGNGDVLRISLSSYPIA